MPPAPVHPAPLVVAQEVVVQSVPDTRTAVARPVAPAAAVPVSDQTAAALNLVASVSDAHSAFLERQAQAHTSFLKSRGDLLALVSGRRGSAPAAVASASSALHLHLHLHR